MSKYVDFVSFYEESYYENQLMGPKPHLESYFSLPKLVFLWSFLAIREKRTRINMIQNLNSFLHISQQK